MFADPSGSGKSTLIQEVKKSFHVGYFINADIIEAQLKRGRAMVNKDVIPFDYDVYY
jgi:predicted ABC-type ATPase